jgi:hypothetical protein
LYRVSGGDEGRVSRAFVRASRRFLPLLGALVVLVVLVVLGGCVKPLVSGDFEPDGRSARLNADEARDFLSAALGPECTRLAKDGATPTGEARVTVEVAQSGEVLKSRLTQRTGDARIDELFGTTAARMKFDADTPRPPTYTGRMRMGYSCNGNAGIGTIDLF